MAGSIKGGGGLGFWRIRPFLLDCLGGGEQVGWGGGEGVTGGQGNTRNKQEGSIHVGKGEE